MITFAEDIKDVSIYLSLRQQVGWVSLTTEQAQQALDHSLKIITVYDDECPIGMGRIVGDGAVILLYSGFDYYSGISEPAHRQYVD